MHRGRANDSESIRVRPELTQINLGQSALRTPPAVRGLGRRRQVMNGNAPHCHRGGSKIRCRLSQARVDSDRSKHDRCSIPARIRRTSHGRDNGLENISKTRCLVLAHMKLSFENSFTLARPMVVPPPPWQPGFVPSRWGQRALPGPA